MPQHQSEKFMQFYAKIIKFVLEYIDLEMNYPKQTDAELLIQIKSGDNAAFKEVYDRYHNLLYLFACKKLGDEDEAMDIVQDVFVWILAKRETLVLKTSLSSYLYKSVLNEILDFFKHQGIIRKYIDDGDHFIEVDSVETDYLIREKDIAALIDREIALMPPGMREIYILKFQKNLSPKQIATQLNISHNTVNTQVMRAIKHLKSKLGMTVYIVYVLSQLKQ